MSSEPPDPLPGLHPPQRKPAGMKLPEANEFSPGQVDLRDLLACVATGGSREEVVERVRKRFFADAAAAKTDPAARLKQQGTRAKNALLGARKYGLVADSQIALTELGDEVLAAPTDEEMYGLLARHIIRNLHGLEVLSAIREMQLAGEKVSKASLQTFLEVRAGFDKLPRATTHHTKLLQWLREADVLPPEGWTVDPQRVFDLTGVSLAGADDWGSLEQDQRAFLRLLRRLALVHGGAVKAATVVDAVETEYGPIFRHSDQLAKTVFRPLAEPAAGWITLSGKGQGRGGKSGSVTATAKLLSTDVDLLPDGVGLGIPADLKSALQKPLPEVHAELGSDDTYVKGIALELLSIRIALDLTLIPTRLRERSVSTGGAEVDLVAESAHLHFSRWLIQCKNTKSVSVSALAKEVGMAVLLRAHVVVLVTTGKFSPAVSSYAVELATTSALQVVLVDGTVLERYKTSGGSAIRELFNSTARATLAVKRSQVAHDIDTA